jgi:hypothetical protein
MWQLQHVNRGQIHPSLGPRQQAPNDCNLADAYGAGPSTRPKLKSRRPALQTLRDCARRERDVHHRTTIGSQDRGVFTET